MSARGKMFASVSATQRRRALAAGALAIALGAVVAALPFAFWAGLVAAAFLGFVIVPWVAEGCFIWQLGHRVPKEDRRSHG